jgi:hypothetical protein
MMSTGKNKQLWAAIDTIFVIAALGIAAAMTGVFFWVGQGLPADPQQAGYLWRTYVMSVLASMIPVFLLFVASYFIMRTVQQIRATEEREELKEDVKASVAAGLAQAALPGGVPPTTVGYARFRDDPPWAALIQGSSTIRIVVHYFDTWINQNEQALRTFFSHGGKLYIVLPDYTDSGLLDLIKGRFQGQQKNVLESKIRNTFEKLKLIRGQGNRSDSIVEVYYVNFAPWYCALQFDQRELVLSPYEHERGVAVASPASLQHLAHFPAVREWFNKEFKYLAGAAVKTKKDPT